MSNCLHQTPISNLLQVHVFRNKSHKSKTRSGNFRDDDVRKENRGKVGPIQGHVVVNWLGSPPSLPLVLKGAFSPPPLIYLSFTSDRLRTMTNVLGDSIGAAVIEHLSQRELELQEAELTLPSLGKPYKSLMAQEKGASRGRGGNESVM